MIKILLLLALCSISNAQRIAAGPCPAIATPIDFDAHRFFGKWVATESTPSLFDFVLKCLEVEYENQKDGTLALSIKGLSLAGMPMTIKGDGVLHDTLKNANYNVRYSFGIPFQGAVHSIIDSDYKEYAVVFSCTNSITRLFHSEYIWILTKTGQLTNPSKQNIYTQLDNLKINRNGLVTTDRNGCPPVVLNNQREEEIVKVRSNITNIESNAVNNIVGGAREEENTATENPIKVS